MQKRWVWGWAMVAAVVTAPLAYGQGVITNTTDAPFVVDSESAYAVPFEWSDPGPWRVMVREAWNVRGQSSLNMETFPVEGDLAACKEAAQGFAYTYASGMDVHIACLNSKDGRVTDRLFIAKSGFGTPVKIAD